MLIAHRSRSHILPIGTNSHIGYRPLQRLTKGSHQLHSLTVPYRDKRPSAHLSRHNDVIPSVEARYIVVMDCYGFHRVFGLVEDDAHSGGVVHGLAFGAVSQVVAGVVGTVPVDVFDLDACGRWGVQLFGDIVGSRCHVFDSLHPRGSGPCLLTDLLILLELALLEFRLFLHNILIPLPSLNLLSKAQLPK
jgi:hypothetical protein